MNIIQAAGRMRNQTKRIIIGFKDEDDFNYQTLRLVRKNITDSELLNNIESALTSRFNNWVDWENYFKTYTPECKITRTTIEHYSEAENLNEKFTKTKTDWKSWIKELGNYEKALVMKRIEGEEEGFKFEDAPNGKTIWAYTTNPIKAKSLYQLFSVGYDMEKLDEKEINLCAEVIKPANTLTYAIKTAKYDKESIFKKFSYECLVDKIKQNTFSKNEWDGLINDTFEYEYVIDGEKVDVSDPKVAARYMKDKKKMIDIPTEIVQHFKTTIINIVAKNLGETLMDEAKRKMNEEGVGFFEALKGVDINADLRKDLDNYKAYKESVKKSLKGKNVGKAKGVAVKDKFALKSNNSIKFKTRDEAYEYCKNNLGYTGTIRSFERAGKNYIEKI